jgi:hypothetical protein
MQATRTRADEILAGAPLDNGHVNIRQRQFAGQHQPGRTSSDDHHRMIGHRRNAIVSAALINLAVRAQHVDSNPLMS